MEKKMTAVEWLREKFHEVPPSLFGSYFNEALHKEREQMLAASISGSKGDSFEYYYTQTYLDEN